MAGNAQSKLGELFVDIGVNGLGKTLKGLNSVSASFLLTKNAATQLVKPIVNMTHQFGQSAIGLEKMKLTFGTTIEQAQRMQAAFKKLGMQELSGDIQRISDLLAAKNYQGLGENFMAAMSKMNIDIRDYNGSLESTLDLFDKISDGLEQITQGEGAEQARFWAKQISSDYTNLMFAKSQGISFSNLPKIANELSQEEVDKLIKGETKLQDLQLTVFQAMDKIFVQHSDKIISIIEKFSKGAEKLPEIVEENKDLIKNTAIVGGAALTAGKVAKIAGGAGVVGGATTKTAAKVALNPYVLATSAAVYGVAKTIGNYIEKGILPTTPFGSTYYKTPSDNGQYEYRPDLDTLGESDLLGNRTINVTQNITTSDATQAARKSVEGIREAENRATAHQLGSLRD